MCLQGLKVVEPQRSLFFQKQQLHRLYFSDISGRRRQTRLQVIEQSNTLSANTVYASFCTVLLIIPLLMFLGFNFFHSSHVHNQRNWCRNILLWTET